MAEKKEAPAAAGPNGQKVVLRLNHSVAGMAKGETFAVTENQAKQLEARMLPDDAGPVVSRVGLATPRDRSRDVNHAGHVSTQTRAVEALAMSLEKIAELEKKLDAVTKK